MKTDTTAIEKSAAAVAEAAVDAASVTDAATDATATVSTATNTAADATAAVNVTTSANATASTAATTSATTAATVSTTSATTTATDATANAITEASPDRRTLRSKRALREAFAALVSEQGLGNFSVSELSERADLNRGTFYAHFRDMDGLLRCYEDEVVADLLHFEDRLRQVKLRELAMAKLSGEPPAIAVELFDALREHGTLLRALLGERGDAAFQTRVRDGVCANLIRAVLHSKYRDNPSPLTEYYIAYYASGTLGLIQAWLERGMPETSEQIARIMLTVLFLKPGEPIKLK